MTHDWDVHECVHFECGRLEHALYVCLTLGWQDQEGCGQIGLLKWASCFLWVFPVTGVLCFLVITRVNCLHCETKVPRRSGQLVLPGLVPFRALGSGALSVAGTT